MNDKPIKERVCIVKTPETTIISLETAGNYDFCMSPNEAVMLGLALMEAGINAGGRAK